MRIAIALLALVLAMIPLILAALLGFASPGIRVSPAAGPSPDSRMLAFSLATLAIATIGLRGALVSRRGPGSSAGMLLLFVAASGIAVVALLTGLLGWLAPSIVLFAGLGFFALAERDRARAET
ncbi:MAG: hypothetical protein IT307_06065 [Chloroflexi bacterium]|nr:hypothetical protein [Chloroflexota bacterium]